MTDIDRAMRDPRTLEDLIDVVELYGVHVESLTGNIDLTTDAGISAARSPVNQRNQESRNKSRLVADGQRHAAMKGRNRGGPRRPFGWRKDRIRHSETARPCKWSYDVDAGHARYLERRARQENLAQAAWRQQPVTRNPVRN